MDKPKKYKKRGGHKGWNCVICGKRHDTYALNGSGEPKTFCGSGECRSKATRTVCHSTCKHCGVSFETWSGVPRSFCSAECRTEATKSKLPKFWNCVVCGKEREVRHKRVGKYCGNACRIKGTGRSIKEKNCLNCAKAFTSKIGNKIKYCCIECANEHKKVLYRTPEVNSRLRNAKRIVWGGRCDLVGKHCKVKVRPCKICGSLLVAKSKRESICSAVCRMEQARVVSRMARPPKPGIVTCKYCGESRHVAKHANRAFCSKRCSTKWNKSNRKNRLKRNAGFEKFSPLVVFERDDYTCRFCGVSVVLPSGDNAQYEATIDHVVPISKGGSHNLSNVQTLCRSCNTLKRDIDDSAARIALGKRL